MELGVGEALVSFLDEHGRPGGRRARHGAAAILAHRPDDAEERRAAIADSPIAGHYEKAVDRESAYEKLRGKAPPAPESEVGAGATPTATANPAAEAPAEGGGLLGGHRRRARCGMLGGGGAQWRAHAANRGRGGGEQHRARHRFLAGARDRARRARLDHGWPAPVGLCPGGDCRHPVGMRSGGAPLPVGVLARPSPL
jgi:hypothetical protein